MTVDPVKPYEDVLHSIHAYPLPPENLSMSEIRQSNDLLASFGLPERPEAHFGADVLKFWDAMLSPSATIIKPVFPDAELLANISGAKAALEARSEPGAKREQVISSFSRQKHSRNWSGAYISPIPRTNRFHLVIGSWIVPYAAIPDITPDVATAVRNEYRASTWLGIGGHRSYNTLPQIGTSQHITSSSNGPVDVYGAWIQWWVKDTPGHDVPIPILNFDVKPGDQIFAVVAAESPGDIRFNLANLRTGNIVAVKMIAPACILPIGATAEWIHERPATGIDMHPLAKCSDVEFQFCYAWNTPQFGAAMELQGLDGGPSRSISMVETFDAPVRSAVVSVPTLWAGNRLGVTYREAS